MQTLIRITHKTPFPERAARERTLQNHFGNQVQFIDWTPPENPGELFDELREKLMETEAVAVEVDSADRFLSAILAVGVTMLAFEVPVLKPTPHLSLIPILMPVFTEGNLTGYVELKDVQPIATERTDILIS
jgi:hypothetical protein